MSAEDSAFPDPENDERGLTKREFAQIIVAAALLSRAPLRERQSDADDPVSDLIDEATAIVDVMIEQGLIE